MIAKNPQFEKYQVALAIVFSVLYYANNILSLLVAESSKDYTGFFTIFFILYSLDKFMTFVISKAWQYKEGFFAWLLDCFNLGFLAVIYYSRRNVKVFKSVFRLKLLVSLVPMTILQIVYFFNQRLLYRHILNDNSTAISQIEIAVLLMNIIFIAFAFTNSLQKPNIYKADYLNNLLQISFKKYFAILSYNIIHFISYFGMIAILCSQRFYYFEKLSLIVIAAVPVILLTVIETFIVKSPTPILNIVFNHPNFNKKSLKNSLQNIKQNRIRPIRCYIQLLALVLISIFFSKNNPFMPSSYVPSSASSENEIESFFTLIEFEVFRFNMFVYALTFLCLLINLKQVWESFTAYWINEEFNGNLITIIDKLNNNKSLKYIYLQVFARGSRRSSLNQPLIFDDYHNSTRFSDLERNDSESDQFFDLKQAFLDRLIQLQQSEGILSINKSILVKSDIFMVDKDIFDQKFMTSYLSSSSKLPLGLCCRLEKQNILAIVQSRHNIFGIEQSQNVMNLIINNEQFKNDGILKFTENYFNSNLITSITFNKLLTPFLFNLPASILYDLHEV